MRRSPLGAIRAPNSADFAIPGPGEGVSTESRPLLPLRPGWRRVFGDDANLLEFDDSDRSRRHPTQNVIARGGARAMAEARLLARAD